MMPKRPALKVKYAVIYTVKEALANIIKHPMPRRLSSIQRNAGILSANYFRQWIKE